MLYKEAISTFVEISTLIGCVFVYPYLLRRGTREPVERSLHKSYEFSLKMIVGYSIIKALHNL